MIRYLKSSAFWGDTLIRGRRLLEGGDYSDVSFNGAALLWGPVLTRGNKVCVNLAWVLILWYKSKSSFSNNLMKCKITFIFLYQNQVSISSSSFDFKTELQFHNRGLISRSSFIKFQNFDIEVRFWNRNLILKLKLNFEIDNFNFEIEAQFWKRNLIVKSKLVLDIRAPL